MLQLCYSVSANAQQEILQQAFTLKEFPAVIEGMTFDPVDGNFYFGENIHLTILRYTRSGKPAGNIDAAKDGLVSILGMSVSPARHQLWVCGATMVKEKKIMCVFQYDLTKGKLTARFPDTSGKALLFNDVTITRNGSVYTTDTYTKSVYKIDTVSKNAILYLQHDSLRDCNGITSFGNTLYVSTSLGLTRINTEDNSIGLTTLEDVVIAGNDGLYYYNNSLIGIQNVFFPVTVGRYFLDIDGKKIGRASILVAGHPSFLIPTTGVVVNENFYFMANTNIGNYDFDSRKQLHTGKMKKISVVSIPLTRSLQPQN